MFRTFLAAITIIGGLAASSPIQADDAYYNVALEALKLTEGAFPDRDNTEEVRVNWSLAAAMRPYVRLDGGGEAYLQTRSGNQATVESSRLLARHPAGQVVQGTLYWPRLDASGLEKLRFEISPSEAGEHQREYLEAKAWHYTFLAEEDIPGAAWFRYQANLTRRELGQGNVDGNRRRRFFGNRTSNLEDTLALVSGGRALSENLQLDRVLPEAQDRLETVKVSDIEGITVKELDWTPYLKDVAPTTDLLATTIPDDQHALFFPSFKAMAALVDAASQKSLPVLNIAQPRSEYAMTRERYERQLGLSLNSASRFFGPQLIKTVAVTGGDPYLRTGSDVAILFESKDISKLRPLLETQVALSAQATPDVKRATGQMHGVEYVSFRSPNREVCSYVGSWDDLAVVTNSPQQLERILETALGQRPSLAQLSEYQFFRHRYPISSDTGSSLLIISDKTIRRWCGPKWRIATSRRTRAVAIMADVQAGHLDRLVTGEVVPGPIYGDSLTAIAGSLRLDREGVTSDTYGSLEFQTPIVELDIERVTEQEAQLYNRWRDGYQRNWSTFFDPIAVRFEVDPNRLAADATIMPLISNSDYRQFIGITAGAEIKPDAGDPHAEALMHLALAVNRKSDMIQQQTNLLKTLAPQLRVDPLSWLGETVAVYCEDDPVWRELADSDDPRDFVEEQFYRFPVALYAEVSSTLRLTAFLTGIRAFIEQTAPGLTAWESREHNGQMYVCVRATQQAAARAEQVDRLALYYLAAPEGMFISMNEGVIQRAVDRIVAQREAKSSGETIPRQSPPWLGENLCFQVRHEVLEFFELAFRDNYQSQMQRLAWSNIPILNEWKLRYPDQDPVALHREFWQSQLIGPAGKGYRWNDEWQTMESVTYGHPGRPQTGPAFPQELLQLALGNFGLTFEPDGLRARVELLDHLPEELGTDGRAGTTSIAFAAAARGS